MKCTPLVMFLHCGVLQTSAHLAASDSTRSPTSFSSSVMLTMNVDGATVSEEHGISIDKLSTIIYTKLILCTYLTALQTYMILTIIVTASLFYLHCVEEEWLKEEQINIVIINVSL